MAYDVSALTNYVKDNGDILLLRSLFDAKTADIIRAKGTVMSEVKTSENLNFIDTDAVFQSGTSCGFNASGTTTISNRSVVVGSIKIHEALCPKNLEAKATQQKLKAGTANGQMPFEQQYSELKAGIIAEQLEVAMWQGDKDSAVVNLNKFDGLIKIIDASGVAQAANVKKLTGTITSTTSSTSVSGTGTLFLNEVGVGDKIYSGAVLIGTVASITNNTTLVLAANGAAAVTAAAARNYTAASQLVNAGATPVLTSAGITASNVMGILKSVKNAIPQRVKGKSDVVLFCGWDVFDFIIDAHVALNLYAYGSQNIGEGEFKIPGTSYTVIAVHGLDASNRIFALRASNLVLGTDLDGEEGKFEMFYAKEAMETRFAVEFKYGVQVAFPNEVVSYLGNA